MKRANKTSFKYFDFDVISFFHEYDVSFTTSGKNIGSMWVGLDECPFCGVRGHHFGVNLQTKSFHCWGCGERGIAHKWVGQLLGLSYKEAIKVINKYLSDKIEFDIREVGNEVIIPSNLTEVKGSVKKYLRNRKFNPEYLIEKYHLKQTNPTSLISLNGHRSKFGFRIFIPIYMNRELVSYTCRDWTGEQKERYKHPFLEACKIPASSTLYNMDTVKRRRCLILEGPTDVWRMGDECISIQGIEYTKEQIRYLSDMKLEKTVIMFDAGKEEQARKLANVLTHFVPTVQVASLPSGDPGELSDMDAVKIKLQLLQ